MDVHLLGPVEVLVEDQPVTLGATKQRALLAMLALEAEHTVPADRLVEGLWGERVPPSAHKMVQHYVSQLRRVLGGNGAAIVTHGRGYELRLGGGVLDVARFEDLLDRRDPRGALGLWRGPPLADVADEPFAADEIRRLEDLHDRAIELALEADLEAGRHREALPQIDAQLRHVPLSERLHALRMLALYRSGRQADALEAYRAARRALVEEAGVEPGAALRDLHERMLRQDPALDAPAERVVVETPGAVAPAQRVVVERPAEVAPAESGRGWRRRPVLLAVAAAFLLLVAAVAIVVRSSGDDGLERIGADRVGRIGGDGRIEARYAAGRDPGPAVAGGGSVWVTSEADRAVTRIDRAADRVVTIPLEAQPVSLAYSAGAVWVADGSARQVLQIDARTDRVARTFELANVPRAVATGFGAVWVATAVDGGLARIDPKRGVVGRSLRIGGSPTALAAGAGALWATSEAGGSLTQVDPTTGAALRRIAVGGSPVAVVVGAGAVWVANRDDGTVSRIDPARGAVTETVRVGREPSALAVSGDGIWVANRGDGTVSRIDAANRQVTRTVAVGGGPDGLAADGSGGGLWVSAAGDAAAHRGGTLRVALTDEDEPVEFDPASPATYMPTSYPFVSLVYDGLVAYRRTGGVSGSELVADLAESVPAPAGDGRTYAFRLRAGLRYADGTPVRAGDVRASLERTIARNRVIPPLYDRIRGAAACRSHPGDCDLSEGIATDDRTRTVVIRLVRPDAELLHKLALPFGSVLPSSARTARPGSPIPGTGPYRVARIDAQRGALLVRNPRFRSWSPAARPPALPDAIQLGRGRDASDADVQFGYLSQDAAELGRLTARYGGRVRSEPLQATQYLFLNTRTPPFDDVRVRRAVNFAIDRRYVQSLVGGDVAAAITCRILPPGLPGHRPSCPFTRDATPAGAWTAPDLERARRLVAASGTRGAAVAVWTSPTFGRIGPYVRDVLRELGYRARLRDVRDQGKYFEAITGGRQDPQVGITVWFADSLSPSNFIDPNFTCSGGMANLSRLCDRRLDGLAARARDAVDPAAADARWGAVERRLERLAPAVPLLHTRQLTILGERTGNFRNHPLWGPLLDQLTVR